MIGLVSISFREKSCEEILDLCVKNGVECIEWGGDVHVPAGDLERAKEVRAMTEKSGVRIYSYGSYYRAGENVRPAEAFMDVLQTAKALGAAVIRVWAGRQSSKTADEAYVTRVIADLHTIAEMAGREGMTVALEYHRNTLTEECRMARRLMYEANSKYLRLYWQPNPDISHAERMEELESLWMHIVNVHVFHWVHGNERRPLREGAHLWPQYVDYLGKEIPYMLEFVRDNSEEQFAEDVRTLKEILA